MSKVAFERIVKRFARQGPPDAARIDEAAAEFAALTAILDGRARRPGIRRRAAVDRRLRARGTLLAGRSVRPRHLALRAGRIVAGARARAR
jgi:hypothetical protein